MRQSHQLVINGQLQGFAKGVNAEGRFAFVSGVTGRGATIGDQAEDCWNTIKERVESLGGRVENIVQRMTFVTSIADWQAEGGPRQRAWLQKNCPSLIENPPAGTLIGCVGLAQPEYKVEIQVVVALD
ncbi:MAG TPA: Rid family hydrolase [Chloroflexota bacterium]|nr:Rid family hydrolase [Chloroflexota bacterium]